MKLKTKNREKLEEWYANYMTEIMYDLSTENEIFGYMLEHGFIGAKELTDEELLDEYIIQARTYDRGSLL